jgi:hypothetical protein
MHQDYDKIIKETLRKTVQPLLKTLLGFAIANVENVAQSIPRTIVRRTDLLKIATDTRTGMRKLYHIEFQSSNHPKMANRMLTYFALINEWYELPVAQYVVYLGEGVPAMPTTLQFDNLQFSYHIIAINTIDYEVFMNSERPEEMGSGFY